MKNIKTKIILTIVSTLFAFGCGNGLDGHANVQYAALGASDATGVGASPITKGYVYLIKDGIENAGKSVNQMNYGVPDIEIGGIRDVELKALDIGFKPDVVTVFIGANDIIAGASTGHFETDFDFILNHLAKISGVKIYVADIPNLTLLPRFTKTPDTDVTTSRIQQFNEIISRVSAKYNAVVITLSRDPVIDSEISDDGLHPNNLGYARIANEFLQDILPAL